MGIAKDIVSDVPRLAEVLSDILSGYPEQANSLTAYSKTTAVVARVYIDDTLLGEDICVPLMGALNQIYISYVMSALQLNNAIANFSVIKHAIARVATEGYSDVLGAIDDHFDKSVRPSMEAKMLEVDKAVQHLAAGKVIEFEFIVGKDDKGKPITVTVPIHVSMFPLAITPAVSEAFLALNFTPTFGHRYLQWKAGEISLFRDMILSRDLIAKYGKAIAEDSTNVLKTMMDYKHRSRLKQFLTVVGGKVHNNIASSVLIFNKRPFEVAAHAAQLDFSRYADRQKFFDAALAMLVVVVDPMYDSVDIYYNGLQQYSTVTNRMLEGSGKGDGINMKDLMASIAKGAPKF